MNPDVLLNRIRLEQRGLIDIPPQLYEMEHLLPALEVFDAHGLAPFLPRYAVLDALAGRSVRVHEATRTWEAQALGIADDGALRVRGGDGQLRLVHAGDVSVRA